MNKIDKLIGALMAACFNQDDKKMTSIRAQLRQEIRDEIRRSYEKGYYKECGV